MTARTHDAIAFASLITIASLNPPESLNLATIATAVVANIVGGTLPDIDQASNRLWDMLPAGDHIGRIFRRAFLGHRTITHSFLGIFIIYNIFGFLIPKILNPNYVDGNLVFIALLIGYISHLLGDMFTKDGLPLLFPLKIRFGIPPLRFLRITAGSWVENLIILPGIGAYIFWFIGQYQIEVFELIKKVNI